MKTKEELQVRKSEILDELARDCEMFEGGDEFRSEQDFFKAVNTLIAEKETIDWMMKE